MENIDNSLILGFDDFYVGQRVIVEWEDHEVARATIYSIDYTDASVRIVSESCDLWVYPGENVVLYERE